MPAFGCCGNFRGRSERPRARVDLVTLKGAENQPLALSPRFHWKAKALPVTSRASHLEALPCSILLTSITP